MNILVVYSNIYDGLGQERNNQLEYRSKDQTQDQLDDQLFMGLDIRSEEV